MFSHMLWPLLCCEMKGVTQNTQVSKRLTEVSTLNV